MSRLVHVYKILTWTSAMPDPALAWFAEALVHATVLAASVALVLRGCTRPEVRAVLGRAALLGGIVSATALIPGARSWSFIAPTALARPAVIGLERGAGEDVAGATPAPAATTTAHARSHAARSTHADASPKRPSLPWFLLHGLACAAALGALRWATRGVQGRARLANRSLPAEPRDAARIEAALAALSLDHAPRVTVSRGLDVPLALARREIVLPATLLAEASHDELTAVLAHEAAHLARRDPLWLGLSRLAAGAFWFHPLMRAALRGLERDTELAADAWAVARTGRPLALARALQRVASQLVPRATPLAGVAMARDARALVTRVERLVASDAPAPPRGTRAVTAGALAGILALACATPDVRRADLPPAPLDGAAAYRLLERAIERAEATGTTVAELHYRGEDIRFGAHAWDPARPRLVLALDYERAAPHHATVTALGRQLTGVAAAAELARLTKARCRAAEVVVEFVPEVAPLAAAELIDALSRAGVPFTDGSLAAADRGRRIDRLRMPETAPGGPAAVEPYSGPGAEPFEARMVLRLDASGALVGLAPGADPLEAVTSALRTLRRGPHPAAPGLDVVLDRVQLRVAPETPFRYVQGWLAALAAKGRGVWKFELADARPDGGDPVEVFLPVDAGLAPDEAAAPSSQAADEPDFPREICLEPGRVRFGTTRREPTTVTDPGPLFDSLRAPLPPGTEVTLDVRAGVACKEALPWIRRSKAAGATVRLVGSFEPTSLRGE